MLCCVRVYWRMIVFNGRTLVMCHRAGTSRSGNIFYRRDRRRFCASCNQPADPSATRSRRVPPTPSNNDLFILYIYTWPGHCGGGGLLSSNNFADRPEHTHAQCAQVFPYILYNKYAPCFILYTNNKILLVYNDIIYTYALDTRPGTRLLCRCCRLSRSRHRRNIHRLLGINADSM